MEFCVSENCRQRDSWPNQRHSTIQVLDHARVNAHVEWTQRWRVFVSGAPRGIERASGAGGDSGPSRVCSDHRRARSTSGIRASDAVPSFRALFPLLHAEYHAASDVAVLVVELGRGEQLEDGPWSYGGFDRVLVTVMFDGERAALVQVESADPRVAPADVAAIRAWMHAPADADYDHVHNFKTVVGIWAPGMQQRQLARREFASKLTETLGKKGEFAAANGIDLEVSAPRGHCTRATLRSVLASLDGASELKALGFAMIECSGEDDTMIRL